MGRWVWLFAVSELAGRRASVIASLVQSVNLHGLNPWACLRDVLWLLDTPLNIRIEALVAFAGQHLSGLDRRLKMV